MKIKKTVVTSDDELQDYYEFIGYFVVEPFEEKDSCDKESCIEIKEPTLNMTYYNIFLLNDFNDRLKELDLLEDSYSANFAKFYCKLKLQQVELKDITELEDFVDTYDTLASKVLLAKYKMTMKNLFMRGYDDFIDMINQYQHIDIIVAKILLLTVKELQRVKDTFNEQIQNYLEMSYKFHPTTESMYRLGDYYIYNEKYRIALSYLLLAEEKSNRYNDLVNIKIAICLYYLGKYVDCVEYCEKVNTKFSEDLKHRCYALLGVKC